MIEIEFMTGNEQHLPFPEYVKAAGLTHRFTVLQENTYDVRVPDTTFDEAVWRTLIAFISAYAPSAHVSVAESVKDLGYKERPLSIYITHWDALDGDRDPPEVVVLRTEAAIRLCMVTEYYYLSGGPYPYGDACVYSLYSDRDISKDVMAFLHNHADLSRWRFDSKILRAEDVPVPLRRYRSKSALLWSFILFGVSIFWFLSGCIFLAFSIPHEDRSTHYGDRISIASVFIKRQPDAPPPRRKGGAVPLPDKSGRYKGG